MKIFEDRSPHPVDPDTLKAVSNLTVRAKKVVEGLQGGSHLSPHLGASVEFAEHKKYAPGDDIRHIDWRALARTDRYFVKQHQREVILRCLMMLDTSASMGYRGTRAKSTKVGFAVELLAALAHILVRQGDSTGLMTFDSETRQFIAPRRRPDHLQVLMSSLAKVKAADGGTTDFSGAFSSIADYSGRRGMVILVSDLWGATKETEVALAGLAARGHDIVVFHILDPDEIDLPFDKSTTFVGMEGETSVDADPVLVRADYKREIDEVLKRWRRICGEAGIDLFSVTTDAQPALVLSDFVARRHGQRMSR